MNKNNKTMKHNLIHTAALFLMLGMTATACTEDSPVTNPRQADAEIEPVAEYGDFARGADVSWITQMESEGLTFKNKAGEQAEVMQILRDDCGVDAIRLRVWVNPAEGWNNISDVLVKARRAHALGQRLMIDFHFSDTWADPGHQSTPAAWADYSLDQLKQAVAGHVTEMLAQLNTYGIEPEWVQIGNETTGGMLYPTGEIAPEGVESATNKANLVALINAGYDATKAVFPRAKVIIHLDSGDNLWRYTRMFNILRDGGARYDIIGMSLYPDETNYETLTSQVLSNVQTLYSTYGKPVIICEVGMLWTLASECKTVISTLIQSQQAQDGKLQGIFYWEPQTPTYGYNNGYKKGCFDEAGSPTEALDAFLEEEAEEL